MSNVREIPVNLKDILILLLQIVMEAFETKICFKNVLAITTYVFTCFKHKFHINQTIIRCLFEFLFHLTLNRISILIVILNKILILIVLIFFLAFLSFRYSLTQLVFEISTFCLSIFSIYKLKSKFLVPEINTQFIVQNLIDF